MNKINNQIYLTIEEAAALLGIRKRTVSQLVKDGKLKAFKPSKNKAYFTEEMIEKYIKGE